MGRHIWLADVGGTPRQLTADAAYRDEAPHWTGDGQQLLFARLNSAGAASLWLAAAQGGPPRPVAELDAGAEDWFGFYGWVNWSAKFAYHPGPAQPLRAPSGGAGVQVPAPSPADNTAVPAPVSAPVASPVIWTITHTSSGLQDPGGPLHLASPYRFELAFSGPVDRASVESALARNLCCGRLQPEGWAGDRLTVAVEGLAPGGDQVTIDPRGGKDREGRGLVRLAARAELVEQGYAAWSPDGNSLYLDGAIHEVSTWQVRWRPSAGGPVVWAPGGKALVVAGTGSLSDVGGLYQADGSLILGGLVWDHSFPRPRFSPDGARVYLPNSDRVVDLAVGKAYPLTPPGPAVPGLGEWRPFGFTPDGQLLLALGVWDV